MSETFKYKILSWSPETKSVSVDLEDGQGSAVVQLTKPFPATIEEFDKIVRTYSMPKEIIESRTAPTEGVNFDWITENLNIEREAERFSFYKASGRHKLDALRAEAELTGDSGVPRKTPYELVVERLEALEAALAKKTRKKAE